MLTSVLLVAYFAASALGKPMARNLQLHEALETTPTGFVYSGSADPQTLLKLRIALVQNDPAGLENALYDVSTPSSANYGQHLTKEEVEKFVAPTSETLEAVNAFFNDNDIAATQISPAADWFSFEVSVGKANEIFGADFSKFKHVETGKETVQTLSYSIPAELKGHIDLVHPTITFPDPSARAPIISISAPSKLPAATNLSSVAIPASCSSVTTPVCLQALYGIPTTPATQSSNTLAVTGYGNQYANEADLATFLTRYRTDMSANTSFKLQTVDGGSNSQIASEAGIEANLDVQYTIGIASGVPTYFLSVGNNYPQGFLDTVNFLLAESNLPQVITTSYVFNENGMSRAVANNLCNAYAQLGARGTSIMFASGDYGVAGGRNDTCSTFLATFPSSCPYVTSVGSTKGIPETAASFSAGGFSNYFGIPSYQTASVASYLTRLGSTNAGRFNRTGRGFPDVSTQGNYVEIVVGGLTEPVYGTSCSSPIFASVIALLNDGLIATGKPPLGFLNPFLYSTGASAFTGITSGNNPGCGTTGFTALAGWNPVTGLGTPNFAALKAAVGL